MDDMKKSGKSAKNPKRSAKTGDPQLKNQSNGGTQSPAGQGYTAPTMADVQPNPAAPPADTAKKPRARTEPKKPAEPRKKATTVTGHEPVNTPAPQPSAPSRQKLDSVEQRNGRMIVTPEQRWLMIAEAAYYRAERRGFTTEGSENDWYEAEKEICAAYGTPDEQ